MNVLEIEDEFGNKIVLTHERWSHSLRHEIPDLDIIEDCVQDPIEIRKSKEDDEIALYYKPMVHGKYLCVVVQINKKFIVTAYKTDNMKEGEVLWRQK